MLTSKRLIVFIIAGLILSGIAAGLSASTLKFAYPVEVRSVDASGSPDYYVVGRYASIPAALASIGDASSSKPYVIFLPPGNYTAISTLIMKEYVDIQGSGRDNTFITCNCGSNTSPTTNGSSAVISGASNATLRDLSVTNEETSNDYAGALHFDGVNTRVVNVVASASNSAFLSIATYGSAAINAATPVFDNVVSVGDGTDATDAYGLWVDGASEPHLTDSGFTASGSVGNNIGILNQGGSSIAMYGGGASGSGGDTAIGLRNRESSNANVFDSDLRGTGGSTAGIAIYNQDGSGAVLVVRSEVVGDNYGLYDTATSYTTRFTNSLLSGTVDRGTGRAICQNTNDGLTNTRDVDCVTRTIKVAPGTAFSTVNSALTAIGTSLPAASSSLRYTIQVWPGTYNEQITLESYVTIEGFGPNITIINCTSCGGASNDGTSATIVGANNATMRNLSIGNMTAPQNYAIGVYNDATSPTFENVTILAGGGTDTNTGMLNVNGAAPSITGGSMTVSGGAGLYASGINNTGSSPTIVDFDVTATAGTSENYGIYNSSTSNPTIEGGSFTGSGGDYAYGMYNSGSSPTATLSSFTGKTTTIESVGIYNEAASAPLLVDVTVTADDSDNASGILNWNSTPTLVRTRVIAKNAATLNTGISNALSDLTMVDGSVTATGGTTTYGFVNANSGPTLRGVAVSASGGSSANYGMYNLGPTQTITINRSTFTGATDSIYNDTAYTLNIGGSQLDGPLTTTGTGTWVCAETYNASYVALNSSCSGAGSLLPPVPADGDVPTPAEPPALPSPGE